MHDPNHKVTLCSESHYFPAIIDSGAADNFMDETMAQLLNIPLVPLTGTLTVKALDGTLLGWRKISKHTNPLQVYIAVLHTETLHFKGGFQGIT